MNIPAKKEKRRETRNSDTCRMHTHLRRMQLFAITYYYHYRTPNDDADRHPPTTNDRPTCKARLLFGEFAAGMACSSSFVVGWLVARAVVQWVVDIANSFTATAALEQSESVSRWAESEPEAAAKAEVLRRWCCCCSEMFRVSQLVSHHHLACLPVLRPQ